MEPVEVTEFTDPWCSWAWGTEPKLRRLRWRWGDRCAWRIVMGDLVADRRTPDGAFDPVRAAPKTAEHWQHVHEHTGMPWPVHLRWTPSLSADAAHAVKAAQLQSDMAGRALLRALRESCFVHGAPADTRERILGLAATVDAVDVARLAVEVSSSIVEEAFRADRSETRQPNDYVLHLQETHEGKGNAKRAGDDWRYVFPTLLFSGPDGEATVPGWQPWESYVEAMETARHGSTRDPRPDPTPTEALTEWPLLTERELSFLCGPSATAPPDARTIDWGAGFAYARTDAPEPLLPGRSIEVG
ncbi:MAG TPA: DsbA family protein [Acidimicrobiales bacterium]|nr:DsbA family protein [Acidimicrobiales bacterium]